VDFFFKIEKIGLSDEILDFERRSPIRSHFYGSRVPSFFMILSVSFEAI